MPDVRGTVFLREVAGSHPLSVRMILSGNICVGGALEEISSGVVNVFVTKPWTEPEMRRALERASMPPLARTSSASPRKKIKYFPSAAACDELNT